MSYYAGFIEQYNGGIKHIELFYELSKDGAINKLLELFKQSYTYRLAETYDNEIALDSENTSALTSLTTQFIDYLQDGKYVCTLHKNGEQYTLLDQC